MLRKCHQGLSLASRLVTKGFPLVAAALSPTIVAAQSRNTPTLQILYAFRNGTDGGYPIAPLIRDNAGNLYGTRSDGGMACGPVFQFCGVVFELAANGTETTLYVFAGGTDGGKPAVGLIQDTVGNFYGTTRQGGASGNGTVFKLDTSGKESDPFFENSPQGSLIQRNQEIQTLSPNASH